MPEHRLMMLRRFFLDYKQLEGKVVEVDEIAPAQHTYPVIKDALERYSEQRRKGFGTQAHGRIFISLEVRQQGPIIPVFWEGVGSRRSGYDRHLPS